MIDFANAIEPVVRHLKGAPNAHLSNDRALRYGTNGSFSVDLDKGA